MTRTPLYVIEHCKMKFSLWLPLFIFMAILNFPRVECTSKFMHLSPIHDLLTYVAERNPEYSLNIFIILSDVDKMFEKVRKNAGTDYSLLALIVKEDMDSLLDRTSVVLSLACDQSDFLLKDTLHSLLKASPDLLSTDYQLYPNYDVENESWLQRQSRIFRFLINSRHVKMGNRMILVGQLFARFKYITTALVGYNHCGLRSESVVDVLDTIQDCMFLDFGDYLKEIYIDYREEAYQNHPDEYTERVLDTDPRRKKLYIQLDDYDDDPTLCLTIQVASTSNTSKIMKAQTQKTRRLAYHTRPYTAIFDLYDDIIDFDGFRLLVDVLKRNCRDTTADLPTKWDHHVLIRLAGLRVSLMEIGFMINNFLDHAEIDGKLRDRGKRVSDLTGQYGKSVYDFHLELARLGEELLRFGDDTIYQRLAAQCITLHASTLLDYHVTIGVERLIIFPEMKRNEDDYGIERLEMQNLIFKRLRSEQNCTRALDVNSTRYIQTINIAKTWLLLQNLE